MDLHYDRTGELVRQQFQNRELALSHPTYDEELAFYDLIKSGDLETLSQKADWETVDMPQRGLLSRDLLRNLKYHLIVMVTMITRFCIEGGLGEQEAYQLSDLYINRIDVTDTRPALLLLQKEIAYSFAGRMDRLHRKNHSIHIRKALDYIYDHLHDTIHICDLAKATGLDETYVSKLFLKELGFTPASFIRQQKLEEAKNMLTYSNVPCGEIAQYLGFASSSHFAQCFKKEIGCTPLKYRREHYRRHW